MFKSSILTLALSLAILPGAAGAETPAAIDIAVTVHDLVEPQRRAALETRIETAATEICRARLRSDLLRPYTLRACIEAVSAAAIADAEALHGIAAPVSTTLAARED